jgi:hypothetical protein
MTDTEQRIIAALEHSEQIAAKALETCASLTLCRVAAPAMAVAIGTGLQLELTPDRVIGVAEWRLFDQLVAQLREAKEASAEHVRQLSQSPDAR